MSRIPEINRGLEDKKRAFERYGIIFEIQPDETLKVELRGSQKTLLLSEWLTQQTGYRLLANFDEARSICEHGLQKINVGLEELGDPATFLFDILHEIGHAFETREDDNGIHHILSNNPNADYEELFQAILPLRERSERTAWEWVLRFLVKLKLEYGWDIRAVIGSQEELEESLMYYYLSYQKSFMAAARYPKLELPAEQQKRLLQAVTNTFNTQYLPLWVAQFWKQLS